MKVPKHLIYLVAPVPLILGATYYLSSLAVPYLEGLFLKRSKELPGVPDFQFQEVKLDRRAFEVLRSIELKRKVEVPVERAEAQEVQRPPEKPPAYRVQFVFLGEKKYAIIDGRLFKEGDPVSPEEKIVKITRKGVLLSGRWGKRWLYLIE